jgi:hypothetical protein
MTKNNINAATDSLDSPVDWWEEALNKLNKELGAITVDARESSTGSDKKEVHATFVPKQHRLGDVK